MPAPRPPRFEKMRSINSPSYSVAAVSSAGASAGRCDLTAQSDIDRVLDEADRAMYVRKAQRRHEAGG